LIYSVCDLNDALDNDESSGNFRRTNLYALKNKSALLLPRATLQDRAVDIERPVMSTQSRRYFMRTLSASAPIALMFAAISRPAAAAGSVPQSAAGYQATPNGDKRCDGCAHFEAPASCKVVAGTIAPSGWCKLYAAK
jgi:hypothetical protein